MNQYENLGHKYLAALSAQMQALIEESEVLRSLQESAEVIAATPHDIEQSLASNGTRVKALTARIAEVSQHLSSVRVSDF